MNAGSLFSGIGGLDAGLARAGFDHAFLCESDEWRRGVLAERFPGVPIYDDVRDVGHGRRDARRLAGGTDGDAEDRNGDRSAAAAHRLAGTVDLLTGGFPCQDLSVAGNRAGLAGDRSGLFFEYARVADALRPRWLLVENVPGLFSSQGGRDFGTVLGTLAEFGYGLAWRVLDSRFFGVPQRRRRVFILGALAESDPRAAAERAGEVLAVGARCDRHPATRGEKGSEPTVASLSGLGSGGPDDNDGQGGRLIAVPLSHGSNPNSNMAGRRREDDFNLVAAISENQRAEVLETPIARQLTSGGGKPGQGYSAVRQGASVRRLTPRECERLQSLPDDWTRVPDTAPDSRRYAGLGDAVTASVGEWIGTRLLQHVQAVAA